MEFQSLPKKHSLAHTQHFMELLGNPGNRCKVIHVAGSNGKGSVCCFLLPYVAF